MKLKRSCLEGLTQKDYMLIIEVQLIEDYYTGSERGVQNWSKSTALEKLRDLIQPLQQIKVKPCAHNYIFLIIYAKVRKCAGPGQV